ncbi:hypothetical protein [Paenibacillus sp. QZ-Y1]|uniref:hypothetical protein n=1 Tax=Paenibacillus sp. QZ-Y1 TaxID=3414511 RepID=UPI003F793432
MELKLLTSEQLENEVQVSFMNNYGCAETVTKWKEYKEWELDIVRSETVELLNKQVLILLDILKSKYPNQDELMQDITDRFSNSYQIDNLISFDMLAGRAEYIYSLDNK